MGEELAYELQEEDYLEELGFGFGLEFEFEEWEVAYSGLLVVVVDIHKIGFDSLIGGWIAVVEYFVVS